MTVAQVKKAILEKAREWYGAGIKKASDLPCPKYWRKTAGWLCFHAPHTGDALMGSLIDEAICECYTAVCEGKEPKGWTVPAETVKIHADEATRHVIGAAERMGRKWDLDSSGRVAVESQAHYLDRTGSGGFAFAEPFSSSKMKF